MSQKNRMVYRDDLRDPRIQTNPRGGNLMARITDDISARDTSRLVSSRRSEIPARRKSPVDDANDSKSGFQELQDEQTRTFASLNRVPSHPLHPIPSSTITPSEIAGSTFPAPLEITRTLVFAEPLEDQFICNLPLDGTAKICTHKLLGVFLGVRPFVNK